MAAQYRSHAFAPPVCQCELGTPGADDYGVRYATRSLRFGHLGVVCYSILEHDAAQNAEGPVHWTIVDSAFLTLSAGRKRA
jgi:hypothetical protein